MARGGKRDGAGRKKGIPNKSTQDVKELIDKVDQAMKTGDRTAMEQTVRALFERSHGVTAQREGRDGEAIVYEVPPDPMSARILLEMRFGKAKETVDLHTPDLAVNSIPIVGMPQLPKKKPE